MGFIKKAAIDLFIVGQFVEPVDIAGVAKGILLMHTVIRLITGHSMEITVYVGRKIGENNQKEAGRAIGVGVIRGIYVVCNETVGIINIEYAGSREKEEGNMKIGEMIAELRKDHGMKQKEVALKLNVAVSTVSNYETDAHEPDLENLCILADLYGVSTDYILGRTKVKQDMNVLQEKIQGLISKADVLNLLEQVSEEDCRYLLWSFRLVQERYTE